MSVATSASPAREAEPQEPPRPDALLTVAEAASIVGRSVRTLRRAYLSGSLRAYRDGNGRSVRIEYADLRDWMKRGIAFVRRDPPSRAEAPRIAGVTPPRAPRMAENLKRLESARARRTASRPR